MRSLLKYPTIVTEIMYAGELQGVVSYRLETGITCPPFLFLGPPEVALGSTLPCTEDKPAWRSKPCSPRKQGHVGQLTTRPGIPMAPLSP